MDILAIRDLIRSIGNKVSQHKIIARLFLFMFVVAFCYLFFITSLYRKLTTVSIMSKIFCTVLFSLLVLSAKLHGINNDLRRARNVRNRMRRPRRNNLRVLPAQQLNLYLPPPPRLNLAPGIPIPPAGGGGANFNRDVAMNQYTNLMADLQQRDLTPEDYTILQRLDNLLQAATTTTTNTGTMSVGDRVIKTLPSFVLNTKLTRNYKKKNRHCSICLEKMIKGDKIKIMPCLHRCHESCLDVWLKMKTICPVCQYDLKTVDEDTKKFLEHLFQ